PVEIFNTTRLGIPKGRDQHLLLRYLDSGYAESCTQNPFKSRKKMTIQKLNQGTVFSTNSQTI
ncbi:MAG: hypothetical protein VXZ12_03380, partial [SAR324 cluster bacterium]|nr:hypothetical protein [SAR324 cluster bacterium]